jgi:hypothetical protein
MADEIVYPQNLTKDMLYTLFDNAYMSVSMDDDGDLKLKEGFNYWVFPEAEGRRIRLMSQFRANPSSSLTDRLTYANKINDDLVVIRAYVRQDSGNIGFDYYITIEGGITKRNIIAATKFFISLVESALRKDEHDVIAQHAAREPD